MTKQKNIRRYIAAACFAGAAVISVISLIRNIMNDITYNTTTLIFLVLCVVGYALIAVSMFSSVPVLTSVGGGLVLLYYINMLCLFIRLVANASLINGTSNIIWAVSQIIFFILIIIAGLNRKSAKVLGITAASICGVRLVVDSIYDFISYGSIGMRLTAWFNFLFIILGAVMLGLVLYDMQ